MDKVHKLQQEFKGRKYDQDVADHIKAAADASGWSVLPWPEKINLVSSDENTLVVLLNNDNEMIITDIFLDV